ncbi:MAG: ketosynthase [bacterium]|nr:MAG: ketosynthase [bacterium]
MNRQIQVLFPLLLLTYPLVLHFSIYSGHIDLVVIYMAFLLSFPFLSVVLRWRRPKPWQVIAVALAIILVISAEGNEQYIVKFVPLSVNAVLLWFFASTLVSGRTPLVTRFASLMRDDMPPAVLVYTRRATIAWMIYFLVILIVSLLLAFYAPIEMWSFFSNILSYVLLLMMFLAEFTVRRMFLHEHMDYTFAEFIQRLWNVDFSSIFRQ